MRTTVEQIAGAAKPRLIELLKLKVRHIYELTPGAAGSKLAVEGHEVVFKAVRAVQVYKDIERFLAEDKLLGFIVTPGVLPLVKAITMDVRGRRMLVTRRMEPHVGVFADVEDFGVRVTLAFDKASEETRLIWECLYAVA
jgi:hypothetical protein